MSETLTLSGWGGQGCSAQITKRDESGTQIAGSSVFVTFRSEKHSGFPSLGIAEVRQLLARMEAMAGQ